MANSRSSRSHAVFTVKVVGRRGGSSSSAPNGSTTPPGEPQSRAGSVGSAGGGGETRIGALHLVDLAGSERLAHSGVGDAGLVNGVNVRLKETQVSNDVNASMLLGNDELHSGYQQVSERTRGRDRCVGRARRQRGASYPVPELQVDLPFAKLARRKLEDSRKSDMFDRRLDCCANPHSDDRQCIPAIGAPRRDADEFAVRHEGEQHDDRDGEEGGEVEYFS